MSNKRKLGKKGVIFLIIFLTVALYDGLLFGGMTGEKATWIEDIEKVFPRAEKCKQCHEIHYSQWKRSRLESSLTKPIFKMLLGIWLKTDPQDEAKSRCLSCHMPSIKIFPQYTEKVINQILSGNVKVEGIGCSGCHLIHLSSDVKEPLSEIEYRLGDIFFGPYDNAEENLAHKSTYAEIYSSSEYCIMCHYDKLQQAHLSTNTSVIVCQKCHIESSIGRSAKEGQIRRTGGHHFSGVIPSEFSGRSRANIIKEWLYRLSADVERHGDDLQIIAHINVGEIAHSLPDGDPLFKEFVLIMYVKDQDGKNIYKGEKIYTRRFDEILKDSRIPIESHLINGETKKIVFNFKVPDATRRLDIDLILTYSLIPQPDPDLVTRYLVSLPHDEQEGVENMIAEYRRSYTLAHLFKSYMFGSSQN